MTLEQFKQLLLMGEDNKACKQLRDSYLSRLMAHARLYSWVNDPEGEVLEMIGEFWWYIKRRPDFELKEGGALYSYLKAMLHYQVLKKKPKGGVLDTGTIGLPSLESMEKNSYLIDKLKKRARCRICLNESEQRIIAYFLEGYCNERIQEEMGHSNTNVTKTMLSRARRKMKDCKHF